MNYGKSKYFDEVYPFIEELIKQDFFSLADRNIYTNTAIARRLGIKTPVVASSLLGVTSTKEERVLDICRMFGADTYISGNGAKDYQSEADFEAAGIKLMYTDYKPIRYEQINGDFVKGLSILDYLFNEGFDFGKILDEIENEKR